MSGIQMALMGSSFGSAPPAPTYFASVAYNGANTANLAVTTGLNFVANTGMIWLKRRNGIADAGIFDTLRGGANDLCPSNTASEGAQAGVSAFTTTGVTLDLGAPVQEGAGSTNIAWAWQEQAGMFDVVTYTGNGANRTIAHSLGVAPELMIVKCLSTGATAWQVYTATTGNANILVLNTTAASASGTTAWNSTSPDSSVFSLGTSALTNGNTRTYVNYLFATLAGFSKVGTYTGTAAQIDIDCGFASSARFIMIKRTDSTGDWYMWDSARGLVAGDDPYVLANSSAAEITNTDYVDTFATGFTVTATAPAALNASGGTYVFLAMS